MPVVGFTGGHSVPRAVTAKNGSGSGIINPLADYLAKQGIKPRIRNYVETIYRDDSGRVVGLKVREGYRFPKEGSGKVKNIQARKAVILYHGGFGADVKYRSLLDPKLTEIFLTTNQPGATAGMWREAARIGSAAFFAPPISTSPTSGFPPLIAYCSIFPLISAAQAACPSHQFPLSAPEKRNP